MDINLATWEPGVVIALVSVVGAFSTGLLISTLSVGLVQWRKVRTLREMREFVQQLIDQGYTVEEIERISAGFFENKPGQGPAVKRLHTPVR